MLRSRICPPSEGVSDVIVDGGSTTTATRLGSKKATTRLSFRLLVLAAVNVVLFMGLYTAAFDFLGYKTVTNEEYENLQHSIRISKKSLQETETHRDELKLKNEAMDIERTDLKSELDTLKQKNSRYKEQLEQANHKVADLGSKMGDLEKQLKETDVYVPTEWEKCMASSGFPKGELHQKGFLSLPPRRNISLEEAFRSNSNTTVYFLHQRKNGGTSLTKLLFDKYTEVIANEIAGKYNDKKKEISSIDKKTWVESLERAKKGAYVPCMFVDMCNHEEMKVYRKFRGDYKLVIGRHQTYHTPFARSMWEDQIIISNFRSPLKRIESCVKYRFPNISSNLLDTDHFDKRHAVDTLLAERDHHGATCVGEAFRILSPFNPDLAAEPIEVQKLCCYVKNAFHIIDWSQERRNLTLVESELTEKLKKVKANENKKEFSRRYQKNMERFIAYAASYHPVVQAEVQLYDCIRESYV